MTPIKLRVAEKLAKIARKLDHSPKAMFILTQRMVRISVAKLAEIRAERRVFRREAAALRAYPFSQQQMERLEVMSRVHRENDFQEIKRGLIGMGYHLIKDTDNSYDVIGFDTLCDLLSINPVHRPSIPSDERGLAGLIYVARLENSVSPQSEEWGRGGPLFEACFLTIMDWIKTAPEEDLPDLFGPDSPFAGAQVGPINSGETLQ
jgi:hypothetical protein